MVDPPPSPLGTKLGAYEILGFIATGGMGTVYRAKNRITGDERALKVMRADLASRPDFVSRFMREAKVAASVQHPHLVRVFEPGMEGDTIFLPMELLEGETLADRIHRQGKIVEREACQIVREVAAAVIALHDQGILHRDLKPSNVFLAKTADGAIVTKVIDLGAAKEVEPSGEATATGITIGSPHYMSVEQASGAKDVDARADQYSLGVVLYQMLAGVRPYENDDSGHALAKLLAGAPFKKPREASEEISAATESAILRALSRDRGDRFPTLADFVKALPSPGDESTRIAPIEERAANPRASASQGTPVDLVAVKAVTAPTDVKPAEKKSGDMRVPLALLAIAILVSIAGLAWDRSRARSNVASTPSADSARPSTTATTPTATAEENSAKPTTLGLQGMPTPVDSAAVAQPAVTTTAAETARPRPATSSRPATTSKHTSASPQPSVVPCTPTPGAPCL